MASKRKREVEESLSPQSAKQMKTEEFTRSGRVRKKPAKFVDDNVLEMDAKDIKPDPEALSPVQETVPQAPFTITAPASVSKIMTAPVEPPLQIKQEMEFSDEDTGKTPNRKSRARKKSAKVLEMEEFEEAEKKQTVKKDGGKKMKSPPAQSLSLAQGALPSVQTVHNPPIPVLKIKDIPSMPKVEPMSLGHIQMSPQKSPIAGTSKSPGAGKSPDNKGSVIKLLLSSPTQVAGPSVSTASVSQLTSVPDIKSPPTGKKSKAKGKGSTIANVPAVQTTSPEQKTTKIRQALQSAIGMPQMNPGIMVVKQSLSSSALDADDMDDKGMLNISVPEVTVKEGKKKGGKKAAAGSIKDESPFLSPPAPSPNVIHVGPVGMGLEVKQETEGLTSSTKKGKKGKMKDTSKIDMSAEMMNEDFGLDIPDMELGEPGDDSFMDMDDEDSLMLAEEDVETERKPTGKTGKKKAGKGKSKALAGESPSSDGVLVMDFARMNKEDSNKKKKLNKEKAAENSNKKKRAPTAYQLWCTETRPKVINDNPKMDFSTISKTLGEMWSPMSEKDKMVWKRKVKKVTGKGSTLITTGKTATQKTVSQVLTARQAAAMSQKTNPQLAQALLSTNKTKPPVDELNTPVKGFGMDPIDVAAHLKILGESLGIIGMKLQEHRGLIAVQGSLSVLLDSMLCALTPLMCLTAVIPETDGLPSETHMKNLDHIAYIMPGL